MNIVKWALGWVTGIAPLILAIAYAIVLDAVDDILVIIKAGKDMRITKKEQIDIDERRSSRRWTAIKALADKLPFFTVE
jgi:co-chaperonin GroES (HSP10)